jgi:hypothetical protein
VNSRFMRLASTLVTLCTAFALGACGGGSPVPPARQSIGNSAVAPALRSRQLRQPQVPRDGTFTTIDDPKGANGNFAWGLDDGGDIVGDYFDAKNVSHGYLLHNGRFTTLDDPEGGHGPPGPIGQQGTQLFDINPSGVIVGGYVDRKNVAHGLILHDAVYTNFDEPNAGSGAGQGTQASGINPNGDIVGVYVDRTFDLHGFLLHRSTFTTVDGPHKGSRHYQGTHAFGINPRGAIVLFTEGGNWITHSFVLRAGKFTLVDDPKAGTKRPSPYGATGTIAGGINVHGMIAGAYIDDNFVGHGFYLCDGVYTTHDDPVASYESGQGTQLTKVNSAGDSVGNYVDSNFVEHGLLYRPNDSRDGGHAAYCDEARGPQ